jgi:predicted nucleic acid-binding protein
MRVVVDTCGWIEWLVDGRLADRFADALENPEQLVVPTVVQFELYKWIRRERDETTALEVIAATEQATIVPLDSRIALLAADLALEHRLPFADAIVYGTARTLDAAVQTCDDHFASLPGVRYFSKKA